MRDRHITRGEAVSMTATAVGLCLLVFLFDQPRLRLWTAYCAGLVTMCAIVAWGFYYAERRQS